MENFEDVLERWVPPDKLRNFYVRMTSTGGSEPFVYYYTLLQDLLRQYIPLDNTFPDTVCFVREIRRFHRVIAELFAYPDAVEYLLSFAGEPGLRLEGEIYQAAMVWATPGAEGSSGNPEEEIAAFSRRLIFIIRKQVPSLKLKDVERAFPLDHLIELWVENCVYGLVSEEGELSVIEDLLENDDFDEEREADDEYEEECDEYGFGGEEWKEGKSNN